MRRHFEYIIKLVGIVILVLLFITSTKAQHSEKTKDTSVLSIYRDSSYIRLNSSIKDKDDWFKLLSEDTILVSFFKARGNNKPYYIYIATIEKINSSPFQYQFMIYSRPLTISPKELAGFGYATYNITLMPTINGKRIISEVKFNGIVI